MNDSNFSVKTWGIVPAAGMSRRMGRPKQLLTFRGSTMAATVTQTLLDADLSGVVMVTRTELTDALHLPSDSRVHLAINDDPHSEMIDSIRIGLAALDQFQPRPDDGVLVVPGDMPRLTSQTCRVCMSEFAANPQQIVIAVHEGRRGHPLIFPFAMRDAVDELDGGLNLLPRRHPERIHPIDVDDPGAQVDVDTARDYEQR